MCKVHYILLLLNNLSNNFKSYIECIDVNTLLKEIFHKLLKLYNKCKQSNKLKIAKKNLF